MQPVFSVVFAAVRYQLYRSFYDSLASGTNVPFEIVFVGNAPPRERMPANFKYITTNVKPAQCVEIAARNAQGKYLLLFSDDEVFSPNFLNRLYDYTLRLDMDKVLITFRYKFSGTMRDAQLVFDSDMVTSSFVGLAGCFRRDLWNQLGGVDNRWTGCYGDMDMQMRFYEYGMRPFLTPDCIIEELPPSLAPLQKMKLYYRCGDSSRSLLMSLWTKDGKPSKKRLLPVASFVDEGIITKSQGETKSTGKKGNFRYA